MASRPIRCAWWSWPAAIRPNAKSVCRHGAAVADAVRATGHEVLIVDPAVLPLEQVDWTHIDACFIALHGGAGEDGRVQRDLGRLGVSYTGSSPEACRLAMSKLASKQCFAAGGVPTLPAVRIDADQELADIEHLVAPFGYPIIVKPDEQGSSIGIAVAEGEEGLSGRDLSAPRRRRNLPGRAAGARVANLLSPCSSTAHYRA